MKRFEKRLAPLAVIFAGLYWSASGQCTAKLTGTAFGTSPAYATGCEYDKAADGKTSTFFDYSAGDSGYTGIDLGSGNAKAICQVRYYPRATFEARMPGGKFQGSNTSSSSGYTDLYTIPATPALNWTMVTIANATAWRWLRYLGPNGGFCNVAEVEYYTTAATNAAPTVATSAAVNPSTVSGTTSALSVLGADDAGEGALVYTWAANTVPSGATVTYLANGTNGAKNTTATFNRAGVYTLQCTIRDVPGLTVASSVNVTVCATLTIVTVSPAAATVAASATQQFTACGVDQFGQAKTATYTWTVSGGGTINATGLFTAGTTAGGPFIVTATSGGKGGTSSVTVTSTTDSKLGGTAFGTAPPYASGSEFNKASDGNTSTFFDYSVASGGYTGIDLGAGNEKRITRIRFYPRSGLANRMNGGKFQGSNSSTSSGFTDLYTIAAIPPADAWSEVTINNQNTYRYLRYLGPVDGFCNIAEMEFYGQIGEAYKLPPAAIISNVGSFTFIDANNNQMAKIADIGTKSSTEFNGEVKCEALLINNWKIKEVPDFVFAPNYKLPSLEYVEKYVAQHQHLPDVPSAQEITSNVCFAHLNIYFHPSSSRPGYKCATAII